MCRESISVSTDVFVPTVTWVGAVGLSIGVRSHTGVARAQSDRYGLEGVSSNIITNSELVFLYIALLGP